MGRWSNSLEDKSEGKNRKTRKFEYLDPNSSIFNADLGGKGEGGGESWRRGGGGWVIYRGFPPMKSDQRRTSEGMPSGRGSFSLMH
jgi:hypothetical protein